MYAHNFGVVRSLNRSESEGFRIQNDCGDWNNHYQILKPSQKKIRAAVSMLASMVKV